MSLSEEIGGKDEREYFYKVHAFSESLFQEMDRTMGGKNDQMEPNSVCTIDGSRSNIKRYNKHLSATMESREYNLISEHGNNNRSIKRTFRSFNRTIQEEIINRYKAILIWNIIMWSIDYDDKLIKMVTINRIGRDLNSNLKTLIATYPSWVGHQDYKTESRYRVETRWISNSGDTVEVSFQIFPFSWDSNISWLKQFINWTIHP